MVHAIGIMGGTFDPIHYAHLFIAEQAREAFNLNKVIFVPAGQPAHKNHCAVTHAEHRYSMVLLATASNPHFECSRVEIDRPGPSYAVDTAACFVKLYGQDAQLFFITGSDTIPEVLTWHQPEKLWTICRFIAVTRPGFSENYSDYNLPPAFLDKIHVLQAPGMEISSTDIRSRVSKGQSINYMAPEPVIQYIIKHKLYGEKT